MKRLTCLLLLLLLLSGCAKTQPETTTAPSTEPVTSAPTTAPTTVPTTEPVTESEAKWEVPDGAAELTDEELNSQVVIVDDSVALQTDIRAKNGGLPILHASISAKWTMRSDRAQNSRTEALNLIRNRKGHLPHIVVVTGEPLPSRLASLALGTGDIDCMYHFALYELVKAVKDTGAEDSIEMLNALIEGKRLKDISDLPLDLSV